MSTYKKSMEKNDFIEAIDHIKYIDSIAEKIDLMGFDFINSPLYDSICSVINLTFKNIYGLEGKGWIEWYLYELPVLERKYPEEAHASDKDGNPIDFSTSEKLWEFLEENYGK